MKIHPIRTAQDHQTAPQEVAGHFENEPEIGSPEADRLEILLTLIDAFEARHHPIAPPDPIEAIHSGWSSRG